MTVQRYSTEEIEKLCFSLSANALEEMPRPVCWQALGVIDQLRDDLAKAQIEAEKWQTFVAACKAIGAVKEFKDKLKETENE